MTPETPTLPQRAARTVAVAAAAIAAVPLVGASPAGAAASGPTVKGLVVAPAALPSSGGTIRLTARVHGARRCTFRGQDRPFAPQRIVRTVTCGAGRASTLVSIGANTRRSRETLRFSVTAADAQGRTARHTVSLIEAAAPAELVAVNAPLAAATVGQPYSAALAAHGGTPGYTWVVTGGGLPAGLVLSADGTITGAPTAPGGSSFTVSVTDAGSPTPQTASVTLTLPVGGGTVISTTPQPTTYEDNWSGYAELGTFTGVTGTFTVPSLAPGSSPSTVSEWVGLDGAQPTDTTVIQAGVDESWTQGNPSPAFTAWWEIWPAAGTSVAVPVAAGDRVNVTIGAVGGGVWRIQFTDLTTGYTSSTDQRYAGPATSAEWIVEAPKDMTTGAVLALAPFASPVVFTDLFTAGAPTELKSFTMVNGPQVEAVPSGISGTGFAVAYGATPPSAP